jgi:anti-sigma B factor antagonist
VIDLSEKVIVIPENFAIDEAADFREKLYQQISGGIIDFIVDFSKCTFIDSTGLGVLVSVYKSCIQKGGSIKMIHMDDKVYKVFKLTRLDSIFNITR